MRHYFVQCLGGTGLGWVAIATLPLAVGACSSEGKPDDKIARAFDHLCSEKNLLDEANRAKWIQLTAAIDRGDIQREQLSFAPAPRTSARKDRRSLSSKERNSLKTPVEVFAGDVMPVAGLAENNDSGVFQGPLAVLMDGKPVLEFRNFYLAYRISHLSLYGKPVHIIDCFSQKGDNYRAYIGRQR